MQSFAAKQTLILIVISSLFAILIPVCNIFYIFPSFKQTIIKNAEIEAERITHYFVKELIIEGNLPEKFSYADQKIQKLKQPLNFFKMRIFSPGGTIIYSTQKEEIGTQNTKKYFHEIVALGEKFTKVVEKNTGKTQEGKSLTIDVVETYVPIMDGGKFIGAFELYYDITDRSERFNKTISRISFVTFAGIVILLVFANLVVFREREKVVLPANQLSFIHRSPLAPPIVIGILIFLAEGLIMLLLSAWPELSIFSEIIIDATLLLMILVPALYFFLFRPLMRHIAERKQIEKKLQTAKDAAEKANEKLTEKISEHRRTESALKRSERDLNRAQHISKTGSWYYDWTTDIEIWSDECFNLYGIKKEAYPDNIVPESMSEKVYKEPMKIQSLSESLAEKHDTYELEFTTVPIDGQVKIIHSYCEVERDNNGNMIKVFGTDQDITERIETENKLKESHAELAELNKRLKKAMFVSSQATADAEIKNYQLEIEINQRIHSENINKALAEISNAINITPDLSALYKTIHKSLMKILDVTNFFIATYDKEEDLVFFPYVSDKKISEFVAIKDISRQKESLIGKVIFSGKPVFVSKGEQIKTDSMVNPGQRNGYLIHAWLGVPLENKGEVVGVMATQSFTDQNSYPEKDRDMFISVARQVTLAIEVKRSNDALLESEKMHKTLAYHDSLTGLPNRKAFYEQLEKCCDRAKRNDEKIALFFLDIDKFKKVNDTLGHGAGDALLVEIGNRLKKSLRKIDFIARMGGDEFTIIVDNHKSFQPEKVAKKIIGILSETYHLKNKTIDYVSSSLGISFYPDDSTEVSQLVTMADQAMYKAKEQGNKYQFYSG